MEAFLSSVRSPQSIISDFAESKENIHELCDDTWSLFSANGHPIDRPLDEDHHDHISKEESHEDNLRDKLKEEINLGVKVNSIHSTKKDTYTIKLNKLPKII